MVHSNFGGFRVGIDNFRNEATGMKTARVLYSLTSLEPYCHPRVSVLPHTKSKERLTIYDISIPMPDDQSPCDC